MKKIITRTSLSLLAVCLLLSFTACISSKNPQDVAMEYVKAGLNADYIKQSKYCIPSTEDLFMATFENARRILDISDVEMWEKITKESELNAIPKDYAEYARLIQKKTVQAIKDKFGKDYSYKVSFIGSEQIDRSKLNQMIKDVSDFFDSMGMVSSDIVDFSKITECVRINLKIYISGEKIEPNSKDAVSESSVYVVKVGNSWKVLAM